MAIVEVYYQDFREYNNKGSFTIECEQPFDPFRWKPPIKWEGYIKNEKISFLQRNASAISKHDFDFTELPENFHRFIPEIITAIDDAMRAMD